MLFDFNYLQDITPSVNRFNNAVEELLERIEKEIGFVSSKKTTAPGPYDQKKSIKWDDETHRIINVTYSKNEEWNYQGGFTFLPKWNGTFDLNYYNKTSEVVDKKEKISVTSFLGKIQGETVDDLKLFWENPRSRKKAA
jgi:hypothetical protein